MRRRIDQGLADADAPQVGLDEQPVELAADDRGEAGNPSIEFSYYNLPIGNLRRREVDRLRVRDQLIPIILKLERSPTLKIFELIMFIGVSGSEDQGVSGI